MHKSLILLLACIACAFGQIDLVDIAASEPINFCALEVVNPDFGANGTIISPNYPDIHPFDTLCRLEFIVPNGKELEINFEDFLLEVSPDCAYDYVQILIDNKPFETGNFCGNTSPTRFFTRNNVNLVFRTDPVGEERGFKFNWRYTDTGCAEDEFQCWNRECVSRDRRCDGADDCSDQSDEIQCENPASSYAECGKNEVAPQFSWNYRLAGEGSAYNNSWPFVARVFDNSTEEFLCVASIISQDWVLTTAGCSNLADNFYVVVGHFEERRYQVSEVVPYSRDLDASSIALLQVAEPFVFTNSVRPVCLPDSSSDWFKPGRTCVVVGVNADGNDGNDLQQARVPINDPEDCRFSNYNTPICGGYADNTTSPTTCEFASGSPLYCLNNGSWVQYGVAEQYENCSREDYQLRQYIDLRPLQDFIEDTEETYRREISGLQTDICSGRNVEGTFGSVVSPEYPSPYPNDLDCSITISPPEGQRVDIRFAVVEIEQGESCQYDRLTLFVGEEKFSGRDFCSNSDDAEPQDFTTNENVTIVFQSDYEASEAGFRILWEFVEDCDADSFRCWDNTCIPSSQRCDGFSDCADQSDEIECDNTPTVFGECGRSSEAVSFPWNYRIVGGNIVRNNSYPWAVALFENPDFYFCVATVISERWLLTAAHCLTGKLPIDIYGRLGNDQSNNEGRKIRFLRIISHPDYSDLNNDIALLQMFEPLEFNNQIVGPVCIPSSGASLIADETCIAIGWGDVADGVSNPDGQLRQVRLPIVNQDLCDSTFPDQEGVFCAGDFVKGGRDTCQGDSGGPLICFRGGRWVQFGVTSGGSGCGLRRSPGFYTDVRRYQDWITENLNSETDVEIVTDICGDLPVIGNSGSIVTPNFPRNYPQELSCSKTITPPEGKRVLVEFYEFDVEPPSVSSFDDNKECKYDYLNVYIGGKQFTGKLFCNTDEPFNFTTAEEVTFSFVSDDEVEFNGFRINWSLVDDCDVSSFRCWDGTCIPSNFKCSGTSECYDQSDEIECARTPSEYGQCGINQVPIEFNWDYRPKPRIVGGSDAQEASYPWVVQLRNSFNDEYLCVATVIDENWLLTSNACNFNGLAFYGYVENASDEDQFIRFDNKFDEPTLSGLTLLRTTVPIVFSRNISPLCLTDDSYDFRTNETCITVGWGFTQRAYNEYNEDDVKFQQLRVQVRTNDDCPSDQICVGDSSRRTTCNRDEGAPLLCFAHSSSSIGHGQWFQVGINTDSSCDTNENGFSFTDVRNFQNWINQTQDENRRPDFNECDDDDTNDCSSNADCINTEGSYVCLCKSGYEGNGRTCTDIDECADRPFYNCDTPERALCINSAGSFLCRCRVGYNSTTGVDGSNCAGYCEDPSFNDCDENADCSQDGTNFSCECRSGYIGNGTFCEERPYPSSEEIIEGIEEIGSNINPVSRLMSFWWQAIREKLDDIPEGTERHPLIDEAHVMHNAIRRYNNIKRRILKAAGKRSGL